MGFDHPHKLSVSRALQWLADNLDHFNPFVPGKPFDYIDGKRVAELAMTLLCYSYYIGDKSSVQVRRIIEFLEGVQGRRDFSDELLRSPFSLVLYVDVYAALRAHGHDDIHQRQLIQRVIDAGLLNQTERAPHRLMDVGTSLELAGFQIPWLSIEQAYMASMVAKAPNALHLGEPDIYVLTHLVLYLYCYGMRRNVQPALIESAQMRHTLSHLLISMCQESHWDLLGEVLFCWECIGFDNSELYKKGWATFLAAQNPDGSFSGPLSHADRWSGQVQAGHMSEREVNFNARYHTTIVSIIAGVIKLSRETQNNVSASSSAPSLERNAGIHNDSKRSGISGAIVAAVSRTSDWLHHLLQFDPDTGPRSHKSLMQLLLGTWAADSFLGGTSDTKFQPVAMQIGERLANGENTLTREALLGIPPTLSILATGILLSQGVSMPVLEDFAREAVTILEQEPDGPTLDLQLLEKQTLLHAIGLQRAPGAIPIARFRKFARELPLTASSAQVTDLLLHAEALSQWGQSKMRLTKQDDWLPDLLSGLAVHFFRQYNLTMGCRIIRSMSYLGLDTNPGFHSCMDFLLLHQRPTGAFGFYGREEVQLTENVPGFDVELDLYLPATVTCLLAIAEAAPKAWRLVQNLKLQA